MEDIQGRFFEHIQGLVPENQSVVDLLADILEVSNDSIYRRLRGETKLTIQEIEKLCNHFNISFDSFLNSTDQSVTFLYNQLKSPDDFEKYMVGIRDHLKQISSHEESLIRYSAEDLPIFHHFNFPKLTAFKLYYWLKAVIQFEGLMDTKFNSQLIPERLTQLCTETYGYYKNAKSIEIWTEGTVISNYKQLEYMWDSGMFEDEESALEICDDFIAELNEIEKYATNSSKVPDSPKHANNYLLYLSDIEIGTNCIQIVMGDQISTYLTFNTMNKILTSNNQFSKQSEQWINNLISKSNPISGVGEKQRYQFFRKCRSRFEQLKVKIETN